MPNDTKVPRRTETEQLVHENENTVILMNLDSVAITHVEDSYDHIGEQEHKHSMDTVRS